MYTQKCFKLFKHFFKLILIISPPGPPVKADSTEHFLKGNTMQKIKISTDSTADIPREIREELNIKVVPLTIVDGDRQYKDGYDLTPQEFYRILDEAAVLPSSSQATPVQFMELFEETWKQGYTHLIHTSINSKGSATFQSAMQAKTFFFEEHPEAEKAFSITLIDSLTYSMCYGWPVIAAARMVNEGKSAEEITDHIQEWVAHTRPMFVPLNLRCVKKSGRITPAAAFVGDALGLKPMITFENGEAKILSKVRGEAKAINALVETCLKERKPGSPYQIVYGSNQRQREKLREALSKVMDQPPEFEYPVGCIIGINTGPDMIGIIYRT